MSSNNTPPTTPPPTPSTNTSNDTLARLVKELNNAILALRTLIEREYPNRREIEAEFVRKTSSDKRMRVVLATILVSSMLGFFGSVTTVSACFLGDLKHPDACNLLPGYADAYERNDVLLKQFRDLVEGQRQMDRRLNQLERES